jgi:hypothetical protein
MQGFGLSCCGLASIFSSTSVRLFYYGGFPSTSGGSRFNLEVFEERRYDGCNSGHEDDTVGSPEIETKVAKSDDVRISPLSHLPVLLLF